MAVVSDPISDMLTRIRNACQAGHRTVIMPSSKMKAAIAEALKQAGYIVDFTVAGDVKKTLSLTLKYEGKVPVIEGLKRVSTPSCRMYVSSDEIPHVQGGMGVSILSTSAGVMTSTKARKEKLGGELLCTVW
jgi:small subunit ribosomal protein S8